MITINILFDGLLYPLPVNPSDLTINEKATNTNIDIIGLGQATRKGQPGLRTMKIKSFFPGPNSRYYNGKSTGAYIEFIRKIWQTENKNNKVAWLYTEGIKETLQSNDLSMFFVIDNFDYTYKGGDFDTEYSLSIKEYIAYGVKKTNETFIEGMKTARIPSTVKENVPELMQDTQPTTEAKSYTVTSNDNLWSIAKRCTGDGNNWKALYEANKNVIGGNPNLIYAGQTLILPENWNSPSAKTNVSTSTKVKTGSNNKKPILNNSTTTTKVEVSKQTATTQSEDNYFDAPERQHIAYLKTLQEQHNKYVDNLNVYYKRLQDVDVLENTAGERFQITKAKADLQNMYNKAFKIAGDPNKTPEQRVQAIREAQTQELKLYNRTADTAINRWKSLLYLGHVTSVGSGRHF